MCHGKVLAWESGGLGAGSSSATNQMCNLRRVLRAPWDSVDHLATGELASSLPALTSVTRHLSCTLQFTKTFLVY